MANGLYTTGTMLFALACEVLLKAAITNAGGTYGKQHDLRSLFDSLPEYLRERILTDFEAKVDRASISGEEPRKAFLDLVEAAKNKFVSLRYGYENPPPQGEFTEEVDIGVIYAVLEANLSELFGIQWESAQIYGGLVSADQYSAPTTRKS
ncbi:MAG: HEPN domain-containing protein [Trueperaceae bacterium]|nr:HEPN domain-containing protein [Trueperaceae bacterium]